MLAFVAILIRMSLVKLSRLHFYWDKSRFGSDFIANQMNFNCFKMIYSCIHLVDEEEALEAGSSIPKHENYDKNYKLSEYMNKAFSASQKCRRPKKRLTVDEMMAKFAVCYVPFTYIPLQNIFDIHFSKHVRVVSVVWS